MLNLKPKSSNISKVCKEKAYESNGFQWRYLNEDIDYTLNIGKSPLKERRQLGACMTLKNHSHQSKKIAQCDKKTHDIIQIFNSVKEASEITGVYHTNIYRVCNKERNSAGGYYWINI